MIIPVPLAILREIHFICSSQFSLLSIIIPKNFALSTSWILDPFILIVGQISFFPLGLNIIKFVLSILRDNRLAFHHLITLLSSLFITVDNSCKLLALQDNVVSSANRIGKSAQDTEAVSFMYSKNIMSRKLNLVGHCRWSVSYQMKYCCNWHIDIDLLDSN